VRIANYFRIQGNSLQAMECYRKAIFLDPNDSDVLMNVARFFYNLEFYDDSIEITRKSIDSMKPGQVAFEQHYTLAQILIAYGNEAQAVLHLQYSLKLKPNYELSQILLDEIQKLDSSMSYSSIFFYIFFSILFIFVSILIFLIVSDKMNQNSKSKADEVKREEPNDKRRKSSHNVSDSDGDHSRRKNQQSIPKNVKQAKSRRI
jgi:tetratricopeptide (TPR) repeat protein